MEDGPVSAIWPSPPSENPFVGGGMHKSPKQADLNGRALRRAVNRGDGMPGKNKATKRKKKRRT